MKSRRTGYTLVIISFSIIIVGIVQAIVIREQYRQKSDYFNLQYSMILDDAFSDHRQKYFISPLDSVFIDFDDFCYSIIPILEPDRGDTLSDSIAISIKNVLQSNLLHRDYSPVIINSALRLAGLDTTFRLYYTIEELNLIDFDLIIPVITPGKQESNTENASVISNQIIHESNYFNVRLTQHIDFARKKKIIYKEMRGLLLIVIFTLVVILLAFGYTLRALNKQKKLSELKSDFIDNISHEFKTPLSSISLAASTLKHPVVGSDLMKRIELSNNILNQNKILNEMIDQVIDASMLDNNNLNLKPVTGNLKDFLRELVSSFTGEFKGEKPSVSLEYDIPDSFELRFDKNQFYRALRNLLANSVKYCDTHPEITIRVKKYNDLVIDIIDNGIGISQEEQELIFNRFYRSKKPGSTKVKGLGLGLFIVQKIIKSHGGYLSIESEPGKGTKVSILLPL